MMKKCLSITMVWIAVLLTACGQSAEAQWQEQYDLGVRYLSDGNYEEAIIAFTAAIEIDPKQPGSYLKAAEAYIELGKKDMAIDILEEGYTNTQDSSIQTLLESLSDPFIDESYIEFTSLNEEAGTIIQEFIDSAIFGDDDNIYKLLTGAYLQLVQSGRIPASTRTIYNSYKVQLTQAKDYDTSESIGTVEIRPEEGGAFLYSGMMLGEQLIFTKIVGDCSAWNWNGHFEKDSNYWAMDGEYTRIHMTGSCVNALLNGTISTSYSNGEIDSQVQYNMGKETGRDDLPEDFVVTIDRGIIYKDYGGWLW